MTTLQLPLPFLLQSGNEMDLFKLVDMEYGPKYQRAVTYHEGRHSRRRTPFTENLGNSGSVPVRPRRGLSFILETCAMHKGMQVAQEMIQMVAF